MCGFIAQLVEECTGNAEVTGSNSVEALIFFFFFFRLLPSNCFNWKIYCDDHSSLSWLLKLHGQTLLRFFIDRARFFLNWYYYFFPEGRDEALRLDCVGQTRDCAWIASGLQLFPAGCVTLSTIYLKKKKKKLKLLFTSIEFLNLWSTLKLFRNSCRLLEQFETLKAI